MGSASMKRWASLIVLCAALFLEAMNLSGINVQIPAIRQSLHLSTATTQFVMKREMHRRRANALDIAVASNYILPGEDFPRRN